MRLIDIEDEALLKTVSLGHLSMKALWKRLKNEPTVEAIPIKWLLKKMQEDYDKCNLDTIAVVEIGKLIDDWRKENNDI